MKIRSFEVLLLIYFSVHVWLLLQILCKFFLPPVCARPKLKPPISFIFIKSTKTGKMSLLSLSCRFSSWFLFIQQMWFSRLELKMIEIHDQNLRLGRPGVIHKPRGQIFGYFKIFWPPFPLLPPFMVTYVIKW